MAVKLRSPVSYACNGFGSWALSIIPSASAVLIVGLPPSPKAMADEPIWAEGVFSAGVRERGGTFGFGIATMTFPHREVL